MAEPLEQEEGTIPVRTVTLWLCDPCLDGAGGECHTPGCSLWMNRAPDIPLRNNQGVTVHDGVAPVDVPGQPVPALRTVWIPASDQHEGFHSIRVTLRWTCPQCGGPRGEPFKAISYDGSRQLGCDGWKNPCGHVDGYADVRAEAAAAPVTECGYCAALITLLGDAWTADDGTTACTDTSAPYVPHKPKEG